MRSTCLTILYPTSILAHTIALANKKQNCVLWNDDDDDDDDDDDLVYNWQYADLKNANILSKLANSLSGIFPCMFSDVCCFCLRGDNIITAYINFAYLFWLCVIASSVTPDLIRLNFLWLEPRLESGKHNN